MRKGAKYLALFAAGSMALAACSTGGSDNPTGDQTSKGAGTKEQTITVAWEDEIGSYNNNTAEENAVKNSIVLNQVMRGFWFFGADGSVTPDTEFGTFEKTSDDPLKVKYTFNDKAVWSDGDKIDCDDFLLTWAANAGTYKTGKKAEDGSDELVFSTAGTTGYDQMQKPECADGDQTVEVTYTKPFADWQSMFGASGIMPAHVVEKQSGVADVIEAIKSDNMDELKKAAEFYNTGWVMNPGELNKEITPSAGPYVIDSWEANQSMTLKVNDKWWGTPAKASTIVIRFISPEQQAQALQNNEVQVINPQAQPDLVKQLEAIGDSVQVNGGDLYTYEHLDYNFAGPFKDPELRKAFAMCVPRQTIVDNLIKPVNPNQVLLSLKKIMEGKRLVSEATTSADQQDFRNLFMALSSNPKHEEWKDLYRRLVHWELEMTRSDSPEMLEVLQNQKSEANTEFVKYVTKNYSNWILGKDSDAPLRRGKNNGK